VGDTAKALTGVVNADLTGASVELHIKRSDGTILTVPAVVTDAVGGAWSYSWAVGDLNVDGVWEVEAQVTFSGSGPQTFGPVRFVVQPQIA
jgi:hypothetical protein